MVSHDFPMPRRLSRQEVEIMRTPSEKPTVASEVPLKRAAVHKVIGSALGIINGISYSYKLIGISMVINGD